MKVVLNPPTGSFCSKRLQLIEAKFNMYRLLNEDKEVAITRINPHRDFYNVRKVDTHIHHSASMHAKHLLRFIKKKIKHKGADVVMKQGDNNLTLSEVFQGLGIGWYDLSLDKLNVTADMTVFHRFDRFNEKYNPLNQ